MRIRIASRLFWLVLMAIVVLFMGFFCVYNRRTPPPQSLIVLPGAEDIHYANYAGTKQVRYKLRKRYPAKDVITEISRRLAKQGWKPLKGDFQDTSLPSSHVRGWENFVDATHHQEETVQQWLADWTNAQGEIVSYDFEYRWPEPTAGQPIEGDLFTPKTDKLQIYGIYMPTKLVKAVRRAKRP
jgi:hypothetical protein